jgi:hypothetical protein
MRWFDLPEWEAPDFPVGDGVTVDCGSGGHGPSDGGGGGGGGGGGDDPVTPAQTRTVEERVKECAAKMGVDVSGFARSSRGNPGSARVTGSTANMAASGIVTNNVKLLSAQEIGQLTDYSTDDMGTTFLEGRIQATIQVGPTKGRSIDMTVGPWENYTANDLKNSNAILATQVHELGNSIARILHKQLPELSGRAREVFGKDQDPGARFEDCVFGGRVDKNGVLHPH